MLTPQNTQATCGGTHNYSATMTIGRKTTYRNNEITVVWQPEKCCHSRICACLLPQAFPQTRIPVINVRGIRAEDVVAVVSRCPGGALSVIYNDVLTSERHPGIL